MKYKDAVKNAMEMLAEDERTVFIGYNIKRGSRAYGTLASIPGEKCIEMPVAENLMGGLATGMALEGYRPVVFFERQDFMLNASDNIVNHLSKLEEMSGGQFCAPVIIRAIIGSRKPIDCGIQHSQDFTEIFKSIIKFPLYRPKNSREVKEAYLAAKNSKVPVMVVEERSLYDQEDCSIIGDTQ